jgi:transposase InsO family protein
MPSVRRDTTAMWSRPVPGFALFSHATFPWDTAPGYLLRDHDASYGRRERVEAMGITQVFTAPRSPRQNAHGERVIGLIRRECLYHIVSRAIVEAICDAPREIRRSVSSNYTRKT